MNVWVWILRKSREKTKGNLCTSWISLCFSVSWFYFIFLRSQIMKWWSSKQHCLLKVIGKIAWCFLDNLLIILCYIYKMCIKLWTCYCGCLYRALSSKDSIFKFSSRILNFALKLNLCKMLYIRYITNEFFGVILGRGTSFLCCSKVVRGLVLIIGTYLLQIFEKYTLHELQPCR